MLRSAADEPNLCIAQEANFLCAAWLMRVDRIASVVLNMASQLHEGVRGRGRSATRFEASASEYLCMGTHLRTKRNAALDPPATLLSTSEAATALPPNLLQRLSDPARLAVLDLGRRRDYATGDLLFRQGDHHDGVFLIEEGLVRSFYVSEDGRELTLGFWTAGHYVGAPQMFGGGRHAWTSVAVKSSRCLWLPGPQLRSLAQLWPELALALIDALVHKSQCYCALLQLLATQSMRVRLARLLAMLAASEVGACTTLSHGDMARMIGSTRQWVSITLARFAREGLISKVPGGGVRVTQPQRLAQLH